MGVVSVTGPAPGGPGRCGHKVQKFRLSGVFKVTIFHGRGDGRGFLGDMARLR